MITRKQKEQMVAGLSERFDKAKAAFLVDFQGLNVEKMTTLRKKLFPQDAEIKVVRNTLAKRAVAGKAHTEALEKHFVERNAVVFAYVDPSASAKIIVDFSKEEEALKVKSGIMDGRELTEAHVKALASLPPREVLQAQLLGVLQAPMAKFVRTLQAVPEGFVRVLAEKKNKS